MPTSASDLLAENLRESNACLEFWIASLVPDSPATRTCTRAATPQQMAGLLSELMRAGQALQELPAEKSAGLERELEAYRRNVDHLRELLPAMHAVLLGEQARLEQERRRVESSVEWARRSRLTL